MPYDFTHLWNIKKFLNKSTNKNKHRSKKKKQKPKTNTDPEQRVAVARGSKMVPGEYVNGVNCTVLCITLLVAITLLGIQKAKSNIHMERMYTFYLLAVRDMYLCFQAYDVIVLYLC